jgi:D-alanine--poly(phosphoribitol) ligase subunit 1
MDMGYQYNLGKKFYEVSDNHPNNIALKYPGGISLDYKGLNQLSNQLARFLLHQGLCKNDVIAIFNEKSIFGFSLMLGALKAGIIYTNLDISSPWARIEKILNICKPDAVFFEDKNTDIAKTFDATNTKISSLDLSDENFKKQVYSLDSRNLDVDGIHGDDPSYVMFTSGSTGFPKGAVMTHNNLLNFVEWGKQAFDVQPNDIFSNANPIYFDNSVFDVYISLFNAATLVPINHNLVKNPSLLVNAINESGCTIWFSVPSLLVYLLTTKSIGKNDFLTIKRIAFGGEGFPKSKLKQLFDMFGDRVMLINVYGPTECTCICSTYLVGEQEFRNMNELTPLGFISPNFGYEIIPVDEEKPKFGVLALTGPCVGLGYYNDKERTEQSFVQNPRKKFRQLMYKTGDVVEETADGRLHFKGRIDNQIKHMGYRIELEEIEAAFSSLQYINEVGVIYQKVNAELGQIKAFVSVNENLRGDSPVIDDIKKLLPAYMVPRVIEMVTSLPKNANGKIDRNKLHSL